MKRLVVHSGPPCSGKSLLGEMLAPKLGLVHLEMDSIRMRLIPELPNTRESRRIAYRAMHLIAEANLAAGRDVIVNACYGHAEDRLAAEDLARRCGARLYLVEFHVPLEVALERAAARLGSHPGSDLTPGRVRMLVSKFPYSGAGLAVDSTASPEACLAAIEAYLTSHTSPPNPGAGA